MNRYGKRNRIRNIATLVLIMAAVIVTIFFICADEQLTDRIRGYFGIVPRTDIDADYIRVVDVGQGDSILICSNGASMMIDTGDIAAAENLCAKLNCYGIKALDILMLTHFHIDHAGGLSAVSERFFPKNLILPPIDEPQEGTPAAYAASKVVEGLGGGVYTAYPNLTVQVGDFDVKVLTFFGDLESENDRSMFVMAQLGNKRFLFTADAEHAAESVLLDEGINIKCDVLKVAHHGSETSSSERFLDACDPEYAVISCGKNNSYGHPHETTLAKLENRDIKIYRTDISGDVTFYVENDEIRVGTEK